MDVRGRVDKAPADSMGFVGTVYEGLRDDYEAYPHAYTFRIHIPPSAQPKRWRFPAGGAGGPHSRSGVRGLDPRHRRPQLHPSPHPGARRRPHHAPGTLPCTAAPSPREAPGLQDCLCARSAGPCRAAHSNWRRAPPRRE